MAIMTAFSPASAHYTPITTSEIFTQLQTDLPLLYTAQGVYMVHFNVHCTVSLPKAASSLGIALYQSVMSGSDWCDPWKGEMQEIKP